MATEQKRRGGKKGRKHGRKKTRSASHIRYTLEKRWLTNKAKRVKKNNSEADYVAFCEANGIR